MSEIALDGIPGLQDAVDQKRPIPYKNLAVGAFMNIFQGKSTTHDYVGSLILFSN